MITLPHIGGIAQETESLKVPDVYVSSHSNATDIIYFETIEEYEQYKLEHFNKITEDEI